MTGAPKNAGLSADRRLKGGGLFGRQKGKRLRDEQQHLLNELLPALRLKLTSETTRGSLDPKALFPFAPSGLALEIGFGGGEHLLHRAAQSPETGFIGVEPFYNGVAKAVAGIHRMGLVNIRLHDGDAIDVLDALPASCLSKISILYPDPWPKRRQRKRRFVSAPAIEQMSRVLAPGAILQFASDIDDYLGWTLALVARAGTFEWLAQTATDWQTPYEGWPGTRYEAKAYREGRTPSYLTFRRT